jgi:hypothetical protein
MGEIPKKMLVTSDLEKNLIFQNIMKSKEPLKLTINEIEYTGHIKKIYENSLTVKMNSPFIGDLEGNITTNFTYHNNYHYFSAQAHQMDETTLQLAIPEKINKNMMLTFVSIDISGKVFINIKIMI